MNEETLNEWVKQYEANKTLPSKKIPCSTDGCEVGTTAFGPNLHKKVETAGGIRAFLTTFKCRKCRKESKSTTTVSKSLKESVKAIRKQRSAELVKVATVDTSEISTEEILNVFVESENPF